MNGAKDVKMQHKAAMSPESALEKLIKHSLK